MNVPVLIVSPSGYGKSTSAKSLPTDKTVILNTERKPLPFKNFMKFKNVNINKYKDFMAVLKEFKGEKGKAYDYVVIDSFTSLLEIIYKYCNTVFSGYNIWSEYNEMVYAVLEDIKDLPQQVFITAIPEYIDLGQGDTKAVAKVKGKEWKNSIEKFFAIVMAGHVTDDEEGNIIEYQFDTKPSKYTSAKTPAGMFEERYIQNDMMVISDSIKEYYNGTEA